jgi:hypothetical protein
LRYTSSLAGSHEGLKYVNGQIRLLIDQGGALKLIHYITLGATTVSYPTTAAGWILESTSSLNGSWAPVEVGLRSSNAVNISALISVTPPTNNMLFFRLRQSAPLPSQ